MTETDRMQLLDTVERLMYQRGIQDVGMDEIRTESGLSLKKVYGLFATKDELVAAYLRRRDARWIASLQARVDEAPTPCAAVLAMFDWLGDWVREPGYRGCAFSNSFGELGTTKPQITEVALAHKRNLRRLIGGLTARLGTPGHRALADQLFLLVEGAIQAAALSRGPRATHDAKAAAVLLIRAGEQEVA